MTMSVLLARESVTLWDLPLLPSVMLSPRLEFHTPICTERSGQRPRTTGQRPLCGAAPGPGNGQGAQPGTGTPGRHSTSCSRNKELMSVPTAQGASGLLGVEPGGPFCFEFIKHVTFK